jgi:hypothetical protein
MPALGIFLRQGLKTVASFIGRQFTRKKLLSRGLQGGMNAFNSFTDNLYHRPSEEESQQRSSSFNIFPLVGFLKNKDMSFWAAFIAILVCFIPFVLSLLSVTENAPFAVGSQLLIPSP